MDSPTRLGLDWRRGHVFLLMTAMSVEVVEDEFGDELERVLGIFSGAIETENTKTGKRT